MAIEYKTLNNPHDGELSGFFILEPTFKQMGIEGWELVQFQRTGFRYEMSYTFKKTNKRYEYKILNNPHDGSKPGFFIVDEKLNSLGRENWEFVGSQPTGV